MQDLKKQLLTNFNHGLFSINKYQFQYLCIIEILCVYFNEALLSTLYLISPLFEY